MKVFEKESRRFSLYKWNERDIIAVLYVYVYRMYVYV